jgi:hypothetical protein
MHGQPSASMEGEATYSNAAEESLQCTIVEMRAWNVESVARKSSLLQGQEHR